MSKPKLTNVERKRLTTTMLPYAIIIAGIIAILVVVYEYCPFTERASIMMLPTLIIVLALFLALAIAMLAGDVFALRLYIERFR